MMRIELTAEEWALCAGALENSASDLRAGQAAAERLKAPMPPGILEMADKMDELREKVLAQFLTTAEQSA